MLYPILFFVASFILVALVYYMRPYDGLPGDVALKALRHGRPAVKAKERDQ